MLIRLSLKSVISWQSFKEFGRVTKKPVTMISLYSDYKSFFLFIFEISVDYFVKCREKFQ